MSEYSWEYVPLYAMNNRREGGSRLLEMRLPSIDTQVQQSRNLLRANLTLGIFKLDIATVWAQPGIFFQSFEKDSKGLLLIITDCLSSFIASLVSTSLSKQTNFSLVVPLESETIFLWMEKYKFQINLQFRLNRDTDIV